MENQLIEKYIEDLITKSTPERPMWNVEILKGKSPTWNYIDGCMLKALLELYRVRKNDIYLKFVISYTDYYIMEDGTIKTYDMMSFSLDDLAASAILFDLYEFTNNEKYLKAIQRCSWQLLKQPRTYEGSFWHKTRHPNQVWLDGLYMGQVFYMLYETKLNGRRNYDDIRKQYEIVKSHMLDPETGLYFHGYDASKKAFWCNPTTGLSKGFWLRSLGWLLMSLIEILAVMDPNEKDYSFYKNMLAEEVDSILKYQDPESKMFYQAPNYPKREKNYLETSGSSMVAYAILKGVRLKVLPSQYSQIGLDIFNGICNKYLTNKDGNLNLGGICLMAGLGNALFRDGSYEYYMSEPIVENDAKGVGPFLLAYIETLRSN